ncbi:MAG: glycosyltransferase family 2 protein [Halobacteriota archaeon]
MNEEHAEGRTVSKDATVRTTFSLKKLEDVHLVKVSVVIPSYNRAHVIARSIDSALAQTYRDLEILIVDDGSTDETYNAVEPFFQYPQVRYFRHEKNKGHQAARNTAIKKARGDYVAFLDSDDSWIPEKIELQMSAISKKGPNCAALTAMWWIEGDASKKTKYLKKYEGYVYPEMLAKAGPSYCCLLVPIECLRRIAFLDENTVALADWDTCISLARFYEFTTVDEPCTISHRAEPHSVTKNALALARGYEHIVEKNQSDMLRLIGRRGLAKHFWSIALHFDNAGDFRRCRTYMLKAFRCYGQDPRIFLFAFLTLFGERVFHLRKPIGLMQKRIADTLNVSRQSNKASC